MTRSVARCLRAAVGSISHTHRRLHVGVRVCNDAIAVGDEFTHLCPIGECGDGAAHGASCASVALTVTRILIYGRYVTIADRGMVVEFELSGDLTLRLGPADVLYGKSARPLPDYEVLGEGKEHVPMA